MKTSQATFNKYANKRYVTLVLNIIHIHPTEVDGISFVGATTVIVQNTVVKE